MNLNYQYLTDPQGNRQSVVLSVNDWKKIEKKINAFEEQTKFYNELKLAFQEAKEVQRGKKKAKSLSQLIDELQD